MRTFELYTVDCAALATLERAVARYVHLHSRANLVTLRFELQALRNLNRRIHNARKLRASYAYDYHSYSLPDSEIR